MNKVMAEVTEDKFFIRSNDEGFRNRQAGVFAQLTALEDGHSIAVTTWKTDVDDDDDEEDDDDKNENESSDGDLGKDSKITNDNDSFKVPIGIPKRAVRDRNDSEPDYRVHPDKWTKYTLSDVSSECISEDANSEAAIDFLSSRWKTSNDYEDDDDHKTDGTDPSGNDPSAASCSTTSFKTRRFDMPEFKFAKASKRLKRSDVVSSAEECSNVKLSHVNEVPEEDNKSDCQATSDTAAGPQLPQPSDLFRSVRKRQRYIRSTSQQDEQDDDDDSF